MEKIYYSKIGDPNELYALAGFKCATPEDTIKAAQVLNDLYEKLKAATETLESYALESYWSEEYVGGQRLNFSGMWGEGFELAQTALEEIRK
jgi:hypothetical protein